MAGNFISIMQVCGEVEVKVIDVALKSNDCMAYWCLITQGETLV